ncbi:hypothetical protein ILYODFUR_011092 [Ilyodon furcidens]|uniref:Uncharacterized protein n=1 Tax=Ilyodon furcidens TaxID=33524 RepID=A0ABV0VD04_9TELE
MYTQTPGRERKPTKHGKTFAFDERLHTHCLHAESLPTPSSDGTYCSRDLCYADTLELASLPTPIGTATCLHPCLPLVHSVSPSSPPASRVFVGKQPGGKQKRCRSSRTRLSRGMSFY